MKSRSYAQRFIFIVVVVIISGCNATKPTDEIIYTTGFDFSKYTDQGFLFTPETYLGEYQSIGLITVTLWPPVVEKRERDIATQRSQSTYVVGELNVTKAIDEIYKQASSMGADAITKFNIHHIERMNGDLKVPGAEITGFAIKREVSK